MIAGLYNFLSLGFVLLDLKWDHMPITYRYSEDFCQLMVPAMTDHSPFERIDCSHLKAIMDDAFLTWSSNHPYVHFKEVSDGEDVLVDTYIRSDPSDMTVAHVKFLEISGNTMKKLALEYNVHRTFYVDQSFCATFYSLEAQGYRVEILVGAISAGIVALCITQLAFLTLRLAHEFLQQVVHELDTDNNGLDIEDLRRGCRALFTAVGLIRKKRHRSLSMNSYSPLRHAIKRINAPGWIFGWAILIFVPLFAYSIFVPCWLSQDFQAAAVHEIGHVLGLGHPDEANRTQYDFRGCSNPRLVESTTIDTSSVMTSIIPHRPLTCPTRDDLRAMLYLYPSCEQRDPRCATSFRALGTSRVLASGVVSFLVPSLVMTLVKLAAR